MNKTVANVCKRMYNRPVVATFIDWFIACGFGVFLAYCAARGVA